MARVDVYKLWYGFYISDEPSGKADLDGGRNCFAFAAPLGVSSLRRTESALSSSSGFRQHWSRGSPNYSADTLGSTNM